MPSPITLPDRDRTTLENILAMSNEDTDELLSALKEANPAVTTRGLASQVASRLTRLEQGEVRRIVQTLLNMYSVRESYAVSKSRFVDDVLQAIEDAKEEEYEKEEKGRFQDRLHRFLDLESVRMVSKARSVLTEHDRVYCDARVVTDIRPIFKDDATMPPTAAVLTHMLRIGYHENGQHKEFFVALDTSDVRDLRDVIDRADVKAKNAKYLIIKAEMNYLDVEEGA